MVMPERTFQVTLGFWFLVATINGFTMGMAFAVLAYSLGWFGRG